MWFFSASSIFFKRFDPLSLSLLKSCRKIITWNRCRTYGVINVQNLEKFNFALFWIGFFMTFFGMEVSHVALYSTRLKRRYHIINKKYMISLKKLNWPWNHRHHCIYRKPMHSVTVCSMEHHVSRPSVLKYFCRNNFFITLLAYGIVIRSQLTHNQTYCKQWLCGSQIRVWQI